MADARTDLFIRKPVLAIVVSVFILLLGLRAEQMLPVRQFPKTVSARIEVDTTYYGADAAVVAGFITTPIENAMAQVDGIDYLTSTSSTGSSSVIAHLRLNVDPDRALTEVQTHISAVHDQLPAQSQTPSIQLITAAQGGTFILAFDSKVMSNEQITDYLTPRGAAADPVDARRADRADLGRAELCFAGLDRSRQADGAWAYRVGCFHRAAEQ